MSIEVMKVENIYGLTEEDITYQDVESIRIRNCVNSHNIVSFMVFNLTSDAITLDILAESLESKEGQRYENKIKIYDCQKIKLRNGKSVFDPLIELKKGNLVVPPKSSKFIWCVFSTTDLPPALYKSKVEFKSEGNRTAYKEMAIIMEVVPIFLPEINPLSINLWSYLDAPTIKKFKEQAVVDLHDHSANVFVLPYYLLPKYSFSSSPAMANDFSGFDSTLVKYGYSGKYLIWLGLEFPSIRESRSTVFIGDKWKSDFRSWFKNLTDHLLKKFGSYDDFAIYPIDEGNDSTIKIIQEIVPLIKQIDQKVLIYFDPGAKANLNDLQAIAEYIDIWQPHLSLLKKQSYYDFFMNTGKPLWCYECDVSTRSLSAYVYYKLMGWRAWYFGLQGYGFYSYANPEGNVWDDTDGRWGDNCVIYYDENGIINSRRWEAFAEGMDNYKLLFVASKTLSKDVVKTWVDRVFKYPYDESMANTIIQEIITALLKKQ